ncbi:phospholipase [Alphaproteobacteria bacterium GH1-50]|uniref:Phospholipase D n=2 Tax=Kangsaoukella pontilimi TaxID=2691042 RepID=A0A7C9J3E3_9RHOB|nr:phospholipase [Kangsaoukella pontilimi]
MTSAETSLDAARAAVQDVQVCVTAAEAFPEFERLFLTAETEIIGGFRVFDLRTRLRSDAARAIGETWLDLLVHTLNRGVTVTLVLTDFDPVVGAKYHRKSWRTARQMAIAKEIAVAGQLNFRVDTHGARAGVVPRMALRGKVREKFEEQEVDKLTPGLWNLSENDLFELVPATHHQKLAVFDRKTLYIGGLDLDERRFDRLKHDRSADDTWQDVQLIVSGPVVAAAQEHLESFEAVTDARTAPTAQAPGFVRTLSQRRGIAPFHVSPKSCVTEIEAAHLEAIGRSERFIYLETQFLRHQPLADALARRAAEAPDLHLVVVLPAAPETVAFDGNTGRDAKMAEHLQATAIEKLQEAFGDRVLICSPVQPRASDKDDRTALCGSPIIYVHSKVSIFDTREAIVSSANLNGRSMRWDTEAGVHLTEEAAVTKLRSRLLGHWTGDAADEPKAGREGSFHSRLGELVMANGRAKPEERNGFLVPYDLEAARELAAAEPFMPDELV